MQSLVGSFSDLKKENVYSTDEGKVDELYQ